MKNILNIILLNKDKWNLRGELINDAYIEDSTLIVISNGDYSIRVKNGKMWNKFDNFNTKFEDILSMFNKEE